MPFLIDVYASLVLFKLKRFLQRKTTAGRLKKIAEKTHITSTNTTSPIVTSLRYVERLVDHLGPEGMSSDESDVEGDEIILDVHMMPHRRDVDGLMDFLDSEYQDTVEDTKLIPRRVRQRLNLSKRQPFSDKDPSVFEPSWLSSCSEKPKTRKGAFTWVPVLLVSE